MDTAASGRTDFATRLYARLASIHTGKNLFLSPFSIRVALAMCAVGARGETRRVLSDLIGVPESVEEQHRQFARQLRSLHGDGKHPFQLVTANALWGQQGYHFNPAFQQAVADFYGGVFREVNFRASPDEAVAMINAWVSDRTRARIQGLIRREFIDADTRLILTNAIYFKGGWEKKFKQADTRDDDWHGLATSSKVPTMHQTGGHLYHECGDFQALDLPYKGRQLSLLVVLPRKKDGLASVERQWGSGDTYRRVTDGLDYEEIVHISLPRFKMETEFSLRPVFCGLYAELPFTDEADFGGIAEEPLKISEVVHKACVEVNEEGTEAAAATAVGLRLSTGLGPSLQPKVFKADHPFLFFIRDRKTNVVLFSGRVLDPS